MAAPLDIAICGAGPAGLATALYLQRLGHNPVIFERFDVARPVGSGLLLQPTGQAVLHDLGLLGAMRQLGAPIERLCGTDARSGRVVLDVRYDQLWSGGVGLSVHRAALFNVLHDAVVAAGIPVRTSSAITGLVDRAAGKRALDLGDEQSEAFDLVVDCLGAMSPFKGHSLGAGKSRAMQFGAIWATLPWQDEGFERTALLQRYRRASVMVGVLPVGRTEPSGADQASFFWSLKVADYEALRQGGLAAWKQSVLEHWPETRPYLDAIESFDQLTLARYTQATMTRPIGQGLAFVGDSAHSTSPQLGQGANMALLDARALYLALEENAGDLPAALARYAQLRRYHVRLYQLMSAVFTPFYQSDSRVLPMIRDVFVAYLARIPPAPAFLAALVAGSLLSPVRQLGLETAPHGQLAVSEQTPT